MMKEWSSTGIEGSDDANVNYSALTFRAVPYLLLSPIYMTHEGS